MECNDCLFEGWNEQTAKTHIEMWPDKSEVETHIVRIGHILDKPEGDKMLGVPVVCHHCHCPASHFLRPSSNFAPKQGKAIFRKVVEVAAKHCHHIGRAEEGNADLGSKHAGMGGAGRRAQGRGKGLSERLGAWARRVRRARGGARARRWTHPCNPFRNM